MINLLDLEAKLAAATPGPWKTRTTRRPAIPSETLIVGASKRICAESFGEELKGAEDNAAFIVASRNTLPALIRIAKAAKEVARVIVGHGGIDAHGHIDTTTNCGTCLKLIRLIDALAEVE